MLVSILNMQPAKQDIINRIKQVNNILVTVKASPSVDELSAALGLTIALNNFGKHATAVFSGQIPNAMSFLKPQKIFENDVHSLRDFIISLNKEKADKLRFAKDGEIVKIYITPYKSTITSQDLTYEEGDFNVEMVLAIGISTQEELDSVIAAHGRILHEATVATINPGAAAGQLGSINWSEVDITSASAMVMTLLQELGLPTGISPEIATALLTGIVAGTDRFSNTKTTPKIMELSAQLMNSGADHQLVTSSIGSSTTTQPASLSLNQTPAPTPVIEPVKDQEISLDLHAQTAPETQTPITPPTTSATNVAPMVTSSPEPVAPVIADPISPAPSLETNPIPAPEVSTEISHDQNNSTDQSSFNEALNSVLPQPVDATRTVLPPNLLPPAPEAISSFEDVPSSTSTSTTPLTQVTPEPAQTDKVGSEADKILSEIDDIYSSQPFDPANNPRGDLGANTVHMDDNIAEEPLPSSVLAVDTSVQQDQATTANLANAAPLNATEPSLTGLPAIPDAKQETVSSSDLLGDAPAANKPESVVPGIQMPSVNVPPPPPPPPLEGVPTFTPTIDFSEAQKE